MLLQSLIFPILTLFSIFEAACFFVVPQFSLLNVRLLSEDGSSFFHVWHSVKVVDRGDFRLFPAPFDLLEKSQLQNLDLGRHAFLKNIFCKGFVFYFGFFISSKWLSKRRNFPCPLHSVRKNGHFSLLTVSTDVWRFSWELMNCCSCNCLKLLFFVPLVWDLIWSSRMWVEKNNKSVNNYGILNPF